MRRMLLIFVIMVATLVLAVGTADAVTRNGGSGDDVLVGTDRSDELNGRGGDDIVRGLGGNDRVSGTGGSDILFGDAGDDELLDAVGNNTVSGGDGNDFIITTSDVGLRAVKDIVSCGNGLDSVQADRKDIVASDCERVTRF